MNNYPKRESIRNSCAVDCSLMSNEELAESEQEFRETVGSLRAQLSTSCQMFIGARFQLALATRDLARCKQDVADARAVILASRSADDVSIDAVNDAILEELMARTAEEKAGSAVAEMTEAFLKAQNVLEAAEIVFEAIVMETAKRLGDADRIDGGKS